MMTLMMDRIVKTKEKIRIIVNGAGGSTKSSGQPPISALIVMMSPYAAKPLASAIASLCMNNMVSHLSHFTASCGKPIHDLNTSNVIT